MPVASATGIVPLMNILLAAPSVVEVTWSELTEGGQRKLHLEWVERHGPPVEPPTRKGFGSRLLERVLTTQIHADVTTDYRPEGLYIQVAVPLPEERIGEAPG